MTSESPAAPDTSNGSFLTSRLVRGVGVNLIVQPLLLALALLGSAIVSRTLGPSRLAILAAVTAISTTIVAFSDLGLSRSISKVLPEMAVMSGRESALRVLHRLLKLRILAAVLTGAAWWVGTLLNLISPPSGDPELVGLLAVSYAGVSALALFQRHIAAAAFRNSEIAAVSLVIAIISPVVTVGAALLTQDPYLVSAAGLITATLNFAFLRRQAVYDLDEGELEKLPGVWKRYWRFFAMTHLIFIFNRFVFGLPLLLIVASAVASPPSVLGNLAIAMSIVSQSWDLADMPLANIRAPLISRLNALRAHEKLELAEKTVTGLQVISCGLVAIAILGLGQSLLSALYGVPFSRGVRWGTSAAVVALLCSMFSLGVSTLHQLERYQSVAAGLVSALVVLSVTTFMFVTGTASRVSMVLFGLVLSRGALWAVTDLIAEGTFRRWRTIRVKLSGLSAALLAIFAFRVVDAASSSIIATLVAELVFLVILRVLGGVGSDVRSVLVRILPARLRFAARFV